MTNRHIKLGAPCYINALPLLYAIHYKKIPSYITCTFDHPTTINTYLDNGQIDVGLISAMHFSKNIARYSQISNFGIGATNAVKSVCLFLKNTLLQSEKKIIAIPRSSSSSIALLQALCKNFWNMPAQFILYDANTSIEELLTFDGFLLIGDRCLWQKEIQGFIKIDLAEAWFTETNLPSIFALFAVEKQYQENMHEFINLLSCSYSWYIHHKNEVVQHAAKQTKLPIEIVSDYFETINYSLGDPHLQGLQLLNSLQSL